MSNPTKQNGRIATPPVVPNDSDTCTVQLCGRPVMKGCPKVGWGSNHCPHHLGTMRLRGAGKATICEECYIYLLNEHDSKYTTEQRKKEIRGILIKQTYLERLSARETHCFPLFRKIFIPRELWVRADSLLSHVTSLNGSRMMNLLFEVFQAIVVVPTIP